MLLAQRSRAVRLKGHGVGSWLEVHPHLEREKYAWSHRSHRIRISGQGLGNLCAPPRFPVPHGGLRAQLGVSITGLDDGN